MGLISIFSLSLVLLVIPSSASVSDPAPVDPQPRELTSFKIREPQQAGRGCSYTVKIKTSCSSIGYTRDHISIAFGDVYRNEVSVPRLDNPASRIFERCSTDTFKMQGPCGHGVCYLYLRREGRDGWTPESVTIYEVDYRRSVNYDYNTPLPNAVWYGFNQCPRVIVSAGNATETAGVGLISQI